LFGVTAEGSSLKLVLTFDFYVRHNYGQHFFMNINSRYPVSHELPPGGSGERAESYITIYPGKASNAGR
jgi:hypothetical protein